MLRFVKEWIHRRGLVGAIARNAMEQLSKWKQRFPKMTEAECARRIFELRYFNSEAVFSASERAKVEHYMIAKFEINSIMDFCLISLDIEGGIDPSDPGSYMEIGKILHYYVIELGYKILDGRTLSSFSNRWLQLIGPLRSKR